ncbi:ankyrin [Aspergillus keveii]|uniref:Ankyrin n=1 Tax=Aspergillus keveii TaxID=714993 RepID=A0ABR4GNI2_9EURO
MAWTLSTLPPEILLEICECLGATELARLVQTSQSLAGLGVPVLYDRLFSENIDRKRLLAELKSPYALDYFATRSEKLLFLPGGKSGRTIVYYIVASGNSLLLDTLINEGVDLSAKCDNINRPLHIALTKGQEEIVCRLLDAGVDVLAPSLRIPLLARTHETISRATIERLISAIKAAGGDVHAAVRNGVTPLHRASRMGRETLVRTLLDHGADVLATDAFGHVPLINALFRDKMTVAGILLDAMSRDPRHYDFNAPRGFQNWIRDAYPEMVRILVDLYKQRRIDLDISAATPSVLYTCRWYESFQPARSVNDSVMPVLSLGEMDINAQDTAGDGRTALHLLCSDSGLNHKDRKLELAHFFLDHGADWTIRDDMGDTVLHRAAASGLTTLHFFVHAADFALPEHRALAKLLIGAGCDANARAKNGESVAHWAMSPQVTADSLRFLASLGVGLSTADEEGNPPMHSLATRFPSRIKPEVRVEAIRYLADQGADLHPGCRGCEGWVMRACSGTQYFDMCGR